jgi:hypothetical protein
LTWQSASNAEPPLGIDEPHLPARGKPILVSVVYLDLFVSRHPGTDASASDRQSTEMDIPGQYTHERMRAEFETVARAAKGRGTAIGVGGVLQLATGSLLTPRWRKADSNSWSPLWMRVSLGETGRK